MAIRCPNPDCRKEATIRLQDPNTTPNFQYHCLACGLTWQPFRLTPNEFKQQEYKKYKRQFN